MSKKQKRLLLRITYSTALCVVAVFCGAGGILKFVLFSVPYLIIGGDVLFSALRNIKNGQVFDENFLMAIATVGAFLIGEYVEGVLVMLLYQVGELFQGYAVGRSRQSIASLMALMPDYANIERNGEILQVDPETVRSGDIIIVKAGEKVPLDGIVISGSSALNTAALTGEAMPREVNEGDSVMSGCINLSGLLRVSVTHEFHDSTAVKILDLVENSAAKKSKSENFITRFARYYTPAVVIAAAALAVIPPLVLGGGFMDWARRGLIFLVISCPCALVISVPLSFFGGIGAAARRGILVKGSNYLEALSRADTVVFDKTGTLTKGSFSVTAVHSEKISENKLLELAAHAESYSDHPISRSIQDAYGVEVNRAAVGDVAEIAGLGVTATVNGIFVSAGSSRLMDSIGAQWNECELLGTTVHIAVNGDYAGHIVISDQLKDDAKKAIEALSAMGIKKTVMLTGDSGAVGKIVADDLNIDEVYTELLPADKVCMVEELLGKTGGRLIFVGDGINDAPVLSRADVGIAMGGLGSGAAIEAADIVLIDDKPSKVAEAIKISRRTVKIVKQNIVFALGVKAAMLILGAFGISGMLEAVFADVGVSVIAILNAMRALNVKR